MIDVVTDQLTAIWKHFRYTIYLYREGREQMWNKQKHRSSVCVCEAHAAHTPVRRANTSSRTWIRCMSTNMFTIDSASGGDARSKHHGSLMSFESESGDWRYALLYALPGKCVTPLNLDLKEKKPSHLEKPSHVKGKSYMEIFCMQFPNDASKAIFYLIYY